MKRTLFLLLVLALLVCFASCTSQTNKVIHPPVNDATPAGDEPEDAEPTADVTSEDDELPTFERVADVLAVIPDSSMMKMVAPTYFVCAFSYREGVTLRVVADIPAEIYEELDALDFDNYREIQERELIAPLPIKSVERLDSQIPTQEELDRYVGKTLSELLTDGFEMSGHSIGDESIFLYMTKGISEFDIELDGMIEESVYSADDFDEDRLLELASAFPVKSITVNGLTGACLDID